MKALFLVLCLAGCGAADKLTPADRTDLGVLSAEVALCNTQADPVACKRAVRAKFDAQEKAKFATDGGAK